MPEINFEDFCRECCMQYVQLAGMRKIRSITDEMEQQVKSLENQCDLTCKAKRFYHWSKAHKISYNLD